MNKVSQHSLEIEKQWNELPEFDQKNLVAGYAKAMHTEKYEHLQAIFDLGNPKVIVGARPDGTIYGRIHPENFKMMKLLIENGLK